MTHSKELKDTKNKIKSLQEEQETCEKEFIQLKNREKKLRRIANLAERKKRNHRLVVRGVILESFIEGASEKNNEEIKEILQKVFRKADGTNRSVR